MWVRPPCPEVSSTAARSRGLGKQNTTEDKPGKPCVADQSATAHCKLKWHLTRALTARPLAVMTMKPEDLQSQVLMSCAFEHGRTHEARVHVVYSISGAALMALIQLGLSLCRLWRDCQR